MMPQAYSRRLKPPASSETVISLNRADVPHPLSVERIVPLNIGDFDRDSRESISESSRQWLLKGRHDIYDNVKRAMDVVGALTAIILLSPLFLFIVAGTFLSGGSPFFKHRRVGQGGILFDCLKFRTMVVDADQVLQKLLDSDARIKNEWLRDHKLREDPRITSVGRFLRRTSLDELPQLWNVLRGEMSLVGPRPVVPEELRRYGRKVTVLLSARPGITGLWQISGRNDTDYRRRVALDVCYVRSRDVLLDLYILLRTMRVVFETRGAY